MAASRGDHTAAAALGGFLCRGCGKFNIDASAYDCGEAIKYLRTSSDSGQSLKATCLLALNYFKMRMYSKAWQFAALVSFRDSTDIETIPEYAAVAFWVAGRCADFGVADTAVTAAEWYSRSRELDSTAYLRLHAAFSKFSSRITLHK